jgi:CRISPR-associated endonuclease/helicase Cas3
VDGFCVFDGTIETTDDGWGRSVSFRPTGELVNWLREEPERKGRSPRVIGSIDIDAVPQAEFQPRVEGIEQLRNRLTDLGDRGGILCYPLEGTSKEIKTIYGLDDFFFLYPLALQDSTPISLAFGTDALYLHCHVLERDYGNQGTDEGEFIGL